jgi:hypothetical protein
MPPTNLILVFRHQFDGNLGAGHGIFRVHDQGRSEEQLLRVLQAQFLEGLHRQAAADHFQAQLLGAKFRADFQVLFAVDLQVREHHQVGELLVFLLRLLFQEAVDAIRLACALGLLVGRSLICHVSLSTWDPNGRALRPGPEIQISD